MASLAIQPSHQQYPQMPGQMHAVPMTQPPGVHQAQLAHMQLLVQQAVHDLATRMPSGMPMHPELMPMAHVRMNSSPTFMHAQMGGVAPQLAQMTQQFGAMQMPTAALPVPGAHMPQPMIPQPMQQHIMAAQMQQMHQMHAAQMQQQPASPLAAHLARLAMVRQGPAGPPPQGTEPPMAPPEAEADANNAPPDAARSETGLSVADVCSQIEYYFSADNLARDVFMLNMITEDPEGYVDLVLLNGFHRMQRMGLGIAEVAQALHSSTLLELDPAGLRVRARAHPHPQQMEPPLRFHPHVEYAEPRAVYGGDAAAGAGADSAHRAPRDRRAQGGANLGRAPAMTLRNVGLNDEQRLLYSINIGNVKSGEDARSTLMVRNIPNKYSQKMLLEAIETNHAGKFDLLYLPIDFRNRCNVGYAFVNFISTEDIPAFYEEFNFRQWDRFNSNKVCEITYARIQSKVALIKHFENSTLSHEDEAFQPVVFASDGSGLREKINITPAGSFARAPTHLNHRGGGRSRAPPADWAVGAVTGSPDPRRRALGVAPRPQQQPPPPQQQQLPQHLLMQQQLPQQPWQPRVAHVLQRHPAAHLEATPADTVPHLPAAAATQSAATSAAAAPRGGPHPAGPATPPWTD